MPLSLAGMLVSTIIYLRDLLVRIQRIILMGRVDSHGTLELDPQCIPTLRYS